MVFVPQIALLFVFIAFLEDLGIWLVLHSLLIGLWAQNLGFHGKAFVPMLSDLLLHSSGYVYANY
ncbi:MAG: hypothetical protein CM1200mP25_4910 [Acidobacteriota bacterium]|nr:MAG: hypothetical protein CM1200mP25_4910 [Acidobacteriota bacterium]